MRERSITHGPDRREETTVVAIPSDSPPTERPDLAGSVDELADELEDVPRRRALIESALRDEDLESLRRLSHTMRESAEAAGLDELARGAGRLEECAARVENLDAVREAAEQLIELLLAEDPGDVEEDAG